jgi:hypothetical protein
MRSPRCLLLLATLVASALSVTACVGDEYASVLARRDVVSTAASDHACPKGKVNVVKEEMHPWAYDLDVCGHLRRYTDRAKKTGFNFVEVEEAPPAGSATEPAEPCTTDGGCPER